MNLKTSYSLVALLGLSLVLNACAFKKDDGKEESATPQVDIVKTLKEEKDKEVFNGQLSSENVQVKFEEGEARRYTLIVTWPKSIYKMQVSIDNGAPELTYDNKLVKEVFESEEISLSLLAFGELSPGAISSFSLKTKAPADKIISEKVSLDRVTSWELNRLFIDDGARIITNGHNLNINTKKLIIKNNPANEQVQLHPADAHIITTVPGTLYNSDREQRNSNIAIEANSASGILRVALIGFDGKDGTPPKSTFNAEDLAALNGSNGKPAKNRYIKRPCPARNMDIPCEDEQLICEVQPTNGQDGKDGIRGTKGENGQNGGDTGSLSILVNEQKDFKLEIVRQAGKPGQGSLGSAGSPGGVGGKAGATVNGCGRAQDGKNGTKGLDGEPGASGKPGSAPSIFNKTDKIKIFDIAG